MKLLAAGVLTFALATSMIPMPSAATPSPAELAHASTSEDHEAIRALLERYTQCVSNGDEAGFRALLLDDDIPFSAVAPSRDGKPMTSTTLRRYADFRDAVFRSGRHFQQRFDNVRIEQDGALAQASLDFVTRQGEGGAAGWKVLQLVKTAEGWKIASEFFTVRSLH
jgi:ketosteroid isomerase-like protein